MRLAKNTPTQHFQIKMPRWKERVVGLAAHRVGMDNSVEILATGKDGKRYYPGEYYISGEQVKQCERQNIRGLTLFLVPISMLEPLERVDG